MWKLNFHKRAKLPSDTSLGRVPTEMSQTLRTLRRNTVFIALCSLKVRIYAV